MNADDKDLYYSSQIDAKCGNAEIRDYCQCRFCCMMIPEYDKPRRSRRTAGNYS